MKQVTKTGNADKWIKILDEEAECMKCKHGKSIRKTKKEKYRDR